MDSDISRTYRCIQEDFLHLNFKYLNTTFTLCKFISLIKKKGGGEGQKGQKSYIVNSLLIFNKIVFLNFYIAFISVLFRVPEEPQEPLSYFVECQQACTTTSQWHLCKQALQRWIIFPVLKAFLYNSVHTASKVIFQATSPVLMPLQTVIKMFTVYWLRSKGS